MQKTYSNSDFYLSAFLIAEGYELQDYFRKNGFTTFVFSETDELLEDIRKFHSLVAAIEPVRFSNAIKSLKSLIHTEKLSTSKSNNYNEFAQKGIN